MPMVPAFLLLVLLMFATNVANGDGYVKDACSGTLYQDICIHTLAPYSDSAKRSPRKWAEVAMNVTMRETKNVMAYLVKLKEKGRYLRKRQYMALLDCIESFDDTTTFVHDSLWELMSLDAKTFDTQMGNVETWMSAALTYEDTCLDGFNRYKKGNIVMLLRGKVTKVSCVTSNALAIVTKFASVWRRRQPMMGH